MMWYNATPDVTWLWMSVMMLLFWGGLIALAVWAIRSFAVNRNIDPALEVLRRRLAAGEITQDEYEKTKRALEA